MYFAKKKEKDRSHSFGHGTKIVEYFGLCGAGKTTVHKLIMKCVDNSKVISFEPKRVSPILLYLHALGIFTKMVAHHPIKTILFLRYFSNRWIFLKLGLRIASIKSRKFSRISILKDCGILQPIVSFEIEENKTNKTVPAKEILDFLPLPDIVFFVRVNPDIAMSRYLARESKLGHNYSKSISLNRFKKGDKIANIMCQKLEECGVKVIEILNNSDVAIEYSFIDRIINEVIGYECQDSQL
ncbi:hypothetical protein ACFL2O_02455 [Thermodesulfobacteriota bacterium]